MVRAMLIDGDMPDFFWPLAAQAAIHIKNRVPHSAISEDKTPFELWFKRKPDLSHLRPFGCHVTVRKMNTDTLGKFEPRGEAGRFVGYPQDASGYLIWFPDSKNVRVRRDVKFHEMPDAPAPASSRTDLGSLWDDIPIPLEQRFCDKNPSMAIHEQPYKELDSVHTKELDSVHTKEHDSVQTKKSDFVTCEHRLRNLGNIP
jgi:hypothetical protein